MGIEGIEDLTDSERFDKAMAERPTDQQIKDKQEAEKAAARDEHNAISRKETRLGEDK